MFITDQLIYIQLQKTGCTHIARLLDTLFGGEQVGKHNRPEPNQFKSGKFFLGSVRNPWDWYVSLWAFGCSGQGNLHRRLGEREIRPHLKNLPRHPKGALRNLRCELFKPIAQWQACYADVNDPELFRRWLRLVYAPQRRDDLREGYGYSCIHQTAGLLTYRYLQLHCRDIRWLYHKQPLTWTELQERDRAQNCLDATVRLENLEGDLVNALQQAGYPMDATLTERIYAAKKSNASVHRPTADYYDDEATSLVTARERLIIEKYRYTPPQI